MHSPPCSWPSPSGVARVARPTLAGLGQPAPGAEEAVSAVNCASLQLPSPAPTEGLIVIPSGRATASSSVWAALPERRTVRPVGEEASWEPISAEAKIAPPRLSQPCRGAAAVEVAGAQAGPAG